MKRFPSIRKMIRTVLLCGAVAAPIVTVPTVYADDVKVKVYHEKNGKDHEWNEREDKAYRAYLKEQHRKYRDFEKLKERDRENYWNWRREHSDAQLSIDIR